jgi:hypothetical protein
LRKDLEGSGHGLFVAEFFWMGRKTTKEKNSVKIADVPAKV